MSEDEDIIIEIKDDLRERDWVEYEDDIRWLLDLVEKRGAMLITARAFLMIYWPQEREWREKHIKGVPEKYWWNVAEKEAAKELGIESSSWRKIGEDEKKAIERVIAYMDHMYPIASPYLDCTEDVDVLRRLVEDEV